MLIAEDCKIHKCPLIQRSKIIEIVFYTITKDKEGTTLIITETIDGIFLTLKQVVKPKNILRPYDLLPHFKHSNGTPEDSTETNIFKYFFTFRCKLIILNSSRSIILDLLVPSSKCNSS